jgi:GntR family transcriptional regulator/MocR family aminotransferase
MEFDVKINLMQLSRNCSRNQLFIPKTLLYQNQQLTAMRLGFGNLNTHEMEKSVEILSENLRKLV